MIRRAGVLILSLWMTLMIPVATCHHTHDDRAAEVPSVTPTGVHGTTVRMDHSQKRATLLGVPCLLCGRVLYPLPDFQNNSEGIMPVSGPVAATDPPRLSGKPDLHRLRGRSPPHPPVSG